MHRKLHRNSASTRDCKSPLTSFQSQLWMTRVYRYTTELGAVQTYWFSVKITDAFPKAYSTVPDENLPDDISSVPSAPSTPRVIEFRAL